jgi:iron complex outermembrane receptor protein
MKRFISLIAISIFFSLVPVLLHAQKEDVTLEEVVVTATRDAEEVSRVPASVTVITKEDIEQSNARATVDLLRDEVGVAVRDFYGNGKTASVDIRGFGESSPLNVLVLVDGRRVNEIDLSGTDWTQIPIDQIERIEIVRGPGSVLYGDNAAGGVINIITKRPEKPFSARGAGAVGSYQYSKGTGSAGGTWGPLSAVLNAGYNSTEGYRDNGLLRAKDVGGKIIYDLNDNVSFNLGGSVHEDKEGLPGGLTLAQIHSLGRRATVNPDNTAKTDDGYGLLGTKIKLPDFGRMEADLSYRHREVESFLDFPESSYTDREEKRLRTLGFTPKYVLDKPLANFANKLILGYDFYRSNAKVDSNTIFFGTPSSNQSEVTKRSAGLYFLDEFLI